MAALGFSYWSLVWPPIAARILIAPAYWTISRLSPVPRLLDMGRELPAGLLSFSAFTTGNAVLNYIANNADYLLIGRMLDAHALGLYTFAYTKAFTFSKKVLATAAEVALPVYSAAADERERLERGFYKGLSLMLLLNVPLAGLMAALAPVLIPWLFGAQWLPAVLPFQILCFHVAVNALTSPTGSVTYAIGRPDIDFKVVALMVPFLVLAYAAGAQIAGIVGVAAAVSLVKSIASVAKVFWVFKILGWRWRTFFRHAVSSFAVAAIASVVAGLLLYKTAALSPYFRLIIAGAVFAFTFGTVSLLIQFSVVRQGVEILFPTFANRWPSLHR